MVFPPRRACHLCSSPLPEGGLCPDCREMLDCYRREPVCLCCGRFLLSRGVVSHPGRGMGELTDGLCPHCRSRRPPFDLARSVAPYEGVIREAVHNYKYRNRRYLARTLAGLMLEVAVAEPAFSNCRLVLPVPLSRSRLRRRGFNQAGELAALVAGGRQLEYSDAALVKARETRAQAGLSRRERITNLAGSFQLVRPDLIRGQKIILIDDVFTTGSTAGAICALLWQAGAAEVTVLTLAGARVNE
ncbi:MAG: ComF family protein [Bacillota bacterium]